VDTTLKRHQGEGWGGEGSFNNNPCSTIDQLSYLDEIGCFNEKVHLSLVLPAHSFLSMSAGKLVSYDGISLKRREKNKHTPTVHFQ